MPLAHFTMVDRATNLWIINYEFIYIGSESEHFTYGEKYTVFTGGSEEKGFVTNTNEGRYRMDVELKDNFIFPDKYPQFMRKQKLLKLNELQ
jgi:hypothetical protein